MIAYFIQPRHRRNLAQCAVIFPLVMGLSILAPLFAYGAFSSYLPPSASGWLRGTPFWLWMLWVMTQWATLVRLVRAEPERSNSTGAFHSIQVVCLIFFAAHMLATTGGVNTRFLSIWIICVEVAMVVFFVNYFLLALWTWTRISWHAPLGFALVVASLAFESWSAGH